MTKYNENLSYKIKDNGYEIYNDGKLWITQYEPYGKMFKDDGTYEENCLLQLEEITRPVEESNNDYGVPNEVYNNIIDNYTASITEEVASNGY